MIAKERLEELIGQGATIWNNEWEEIKLDKKNHCVCEVKTLDGKHICWCLCFEYEYEGEKSRTELELDDLEEDVETAKWHYEMDCERTEKLVLPTWEEFLNKNVGIHFYKNGCEYGLHKARYSEDDENPDWRVEIYRDYDSFDYDDELFSKSLTKENYTEACRLARKLFLGD